MLFCPKNPQNLKAHFHDLDMATSSTMTFDIGSIKQPEQKMSFECHLWFCLFFLICFSSQSVLCIPLDLMRGENPSETKDPSPNEVGELSRLYHEIYPRNQQLLSQFDTGSLQSSASQPYQKMTRLTLTPTNSFIDNNKFERERRNSGPSLSIVNPLDVLRQRLLIEIERRRLHSQNSQQINANTEFLRTIGKRRR